MKIKNILYDVAGVLLENFFFQFFLFCVAIVVFGIPIVWAVAWIGHYLGIVANLLPWPVN